MLIKQDLINKIKDYFDLNIYETKVWLALLGKGIASAGEVAEISRVPRSRTYDVLESLEKKGFAIVKLGKPVKYIGVKPKTVLEKLKNNVKTNAEEKIMSLSKVKNSGEFSKLEELYSGGIEPVRREDLSIALNGKSNIANYLREIIQNAKKEIIICTNAEDIYIKLKAFKQTLELVDKTKVNIIIALSGEEKLIKELQRILGIKIRKINIETKFFIIDKKEVLFYISRENNTQDTAVWINSEFFSKAFVELFKSALKNSR